MNRQYFYFTLVVLFFVISGLFAANGFHNFSTEKFKYKINLGLDLVGGSSITLQADFSQYIEDLNTVLSEDLKKKLLENKIQYESLNAENGKILLVIKDPIEKKFLENLTGNLYKINYNKNLVEITPVNHYLNNLKSDAIQESIKNIQKRIDGLGNKEISLQPLGNNRILLQAPGFSNPEELRYAVGKTAKLSFHIVDDQQKSTNVKIMTDSDGEKYRVIRKVEMDGKNINNAYSTIGQGGKPVVTFSLDKIGTEKFAKLTKDSIGKRLAVVIDDEVVTAPMIREAINMGNVEISGNFTNDGVKNLASSLRAGALPIKLNIIEERTVGSSLGSVLINAGKKSLIAAFIIVASFMIIVYGALGLVASLAIVMNICLVICLLIISGGTLSLAGIAGLVLSVGMVVDSNVLIFERIKEELRRNNKSYISAIRIGFQRALSTIIDSNVTTLIAAVLLLWFGDSNIKGFALTLTYGVLISFFSAVFFSKVIVQTFQNKILSHSFWINK